MIRRVGRSVRAESKARDNAASKGAAMYPDRNARHFHKKSETAGQAVLSAAARLRLLLKANFKPNQPREPRGHPEGGRWTLAPGAGLPEGTAHLSDGSTIQIERGRSRSRFDQRIKIVDGDGNAVTVENAGERQRIADGRDRTLVATRWTRKGPVTDAAVLPAASAEGQFGLRGRAGALLRLLSWLYTAAEPAQIAVAAIKAREFQPGKNEVVEVDYVGLRSEIEVNLACPRRREVQEYADEAANSVDRAKYPTAQAYGTAVHLRVKDEIKRRADRSLIAERSFFKERTEGEVNDDPFYSQLGTVRIDVYENAGDGTICIYDLKTGRAGLDWLRALELTKTA
ncbi:MAG: hypothetical protein IPL47_01700 [Phyllobacteriaceae bacterium]|nr:hypothetical protein [Phyllobacteriaceae bacterium]